MSVLSQTASTDEPGSVIEMFPVHAQEHLESLLSAATPSTVVNDAPGDHGPVITGMQGIGVSTPIAAAVAAATSGFACVWHMPNGATFTMGMMSFTVATGISAADAGPMGKIVSDDGARPWSHRSIAPWQTSFDMSRCYPPAARGRQEQETF
jgi:hypothetical protein